MISELARLDVRDIAGVFAARQLGRGLAASLALDRQDQVRVATALSEVSRSAVTAGRTAVIAFGIEDAELLLTVTLDGEPPAEGIAAAARLMDEVTTNGHVVRMTKRRPPGVPPDMQLVAEQLASVHPQSALDELRRQNQDLISALEDLKQQKDQLLLLNSELQETNRGVMALYSELSNELEQTNRGVVALYAELDETSERLRAALESKDRFWANISHELRTPLNSIIGLTRLLAEPSADGSSRPGAALPGRAHQELGQHPARPGQRPARRGQGRVGTTARRPGERGPACSVRPPARAGAPDGGGQARRGDRQRRRRPRHDPDRRGCPDQHPA